MLPPSQRVVIECPAKLNLYLAILGKQADGFHALASVVARTEFGDGLEVDWDPNLEDADSLELTGPDFVSGDNTVNQAIRLFREASGIDKGSFSVRLTKRIPSGAGVGGGSSDAVAMLKAIQQIFPELGGTINWEGIAARIGSDCPLFFYPGPILMEGRGERIIELGVTKRRQLVGTPVIIFKPEFSINTSEAYRRLAKHKLYHDSSQVDKDLEGWLSGESLLPPHCNDFERLLETWMPSLDVVLKKLSSHNLDVRMSGSGSACFVLEESAETSEIVQKELNRAWGEQYWLVRTRLQ
jgi:4-diphosphocytidyl-2-C-methyl-D-erythritol kinase